MTRHSSNGRSRCTALIGLAALLAVVILPAPLPEAHAQVAGQLLFGPQTFIAGSNDSGAMAVGDLNDDGALDLVDSDKVYLNNGKGQFTRSTLLPRQESINTVLADMNGDGMLDLLTNPMLSANIEVSLNESNRFSDGNVHFKNSVYLVDNAYSVLTIGDLNGDAAFDAVRHGLNGGICLNTGHGSCTRGQTLSNQIYLRSTAFGDLNNDGTLDILANEANALYGEIVIYYNDGNAKFQSRTPLVINDFSPSILRIIDINGDSLGDLLVVGKQADFYINIGNGSFRGPITLIDSKSITDSFLSVATGDLDGDGKIDIVLGNDENQIFVYLNSGDTFDTPIELPYHASMVALADLNGDSTLDLLLGGAGRPLQYALNTYTAGFSMPVELAGTGRYSFEVALADLNNDGSLDIFLENHDYNPPILSPPLSLNSQVFINDGKGGYQTSLELPFKGGSVFGDLNGDRTLDLVADSKVYLNSGTAQFSWSVELPLAGDIQKFADLNGDGALDLFLIHKNGPAQVIFNAGAGTFNHPLDLQDSSIGATSGAIGDLNGDSTLDLVLGNGNVYFNDGVGRFATPVLLPESSTETNKVALADLNSDGMLDILLVHENRSTQILFNRGHGTFKDPVDVPGSGIRATSIAIGDLNGDGALDLVLGREFWFSQIYYNDGSGSFVSPIELPGSGQGTQSVAIGDLNQDGTLDLVLANRETPTQIYFNRLAHPITQFNSPPWVAVTRPGPTANANFYSTPEIFDDRVITIPYTLFDPDGDVVRLVRASFSLNGGGDWLDAIAAKDPPPASAPWHMFLPEVVLESWPPRKVAHTFHWDTYASGFFGQSDNVIFRIEVLPSLRPRPNSLASPYQYAATSATTFPFRVRGMQVRVVSAAQSAGISGALVYHLPKDEARGAHPFPPLVSTRQPPLTTGTGGFLRGRGKFTVGDKLMAMVPISTTKTYTLYHTSAAPTEIGLALQPVTAPGIQTLTVSPHNALVVFNLDVSLEWDTRRDSVYLQTLQRDIERASELLFDWSDGQVALGHIRVFQNRENWNDAHIRIYASNHLRPNAVKGGIVEIEIPDPQSGVTETYGPGQVRMGAVWNRYGDAGANLGEDWSRTLAHELGHFALFLDDNYIGLDNNGALISVNDCRGAMSDPYREDDSEFHPDADWKLNCDQTLSQRSTGRSDWGTIQAIYNQLVPGFAFRAPMFFDERPGPHTLPLALTQVEIVPPTALDTTLSAPIFLLTDQGQRTLPSASARAFLFQSPQLTPTINLGNPTLEMTQTVDLGSPTLDHVLARGARPGDRLCVYDPDNQRLGCTAVTGANDEIPLVEHADWRPDIAVKPVTSTTLQLDIIGVAAGLPLYARLYPAGAGALAPVALVPTADGYSALLNTPANAPAFEGLVHVWVDEPEAQGVTRREAMVDFLLGGNPGFRWGRGVPRGNQGFRWGRGAPVPSSDGQAILFGPQVSLAEGQFFALQAASPPAVPTWATLVGRAYRLSTTSKTSLAKSSLSISYLGSDITPDAEADIKMYYWNTTTTPPGPWVELPTRVDKQRNEASALVDGPGLYALMASIEIPLTGPGWNLVPYPVRASLTPAQALSSIEGLYTAVYTFDQTDSANPWKLFAPAPAPLWVNDVSNLTFNTVYWIYVTQTTILRLPSGSTTAVNPAPARLSITDGPPMTFYGQVLPGAGLTPGPGMLVEARIGGALCGQSQTRTVDTQVVYSVKVAADSADMPGCGALGRVVTWQINGQPMAQTSLWDNRQVAVLNLSP